MPIKRFSAVSAGSAFFVVLVLMHLALSVAVATPSVQAQGRISNAKIETRTLTPGSFEREVQAVANRGGATWIGYRTA